MDWWNISGYLGQISISTHVLPLPLWSVTTRQIYKPSHMGLHWFTFSFTASYAAPSSVAKEWHQKRWLSLVSVWSRLFTSRCCWRFKAVILRIPWNLRVERYFIPFFLSPFWTTVDASPGEIKKKKKKTKTNLPWETCSMLLSWPYWCTLGPVDWLRLRHTSDWWQTFPRQDGHVVA